MEAKISSPPNIPLKHKFLPRLFISSSSQKVLRKLSVKRFYIKKVKESPENNDNIQQPLTQSLLKYFPKKAFNHLRQAHFCSYSQLRLFDDFRNLKNLTAICLIPSILESFEEDLTKANALIKSLKRAPKCIESLIIDEPDELLITESHIQGLYRIIRSFRNLKVYWRYISINVEEGVSKAEHKAINRYIPRLRKFHDFRYWDLDMNLKEFSELSKKGKPYSALTHLSLSIDEGILPEHLAFSEIDEEISEEDEEMEEEKEEEQNTSNQNDVEEDKEYGGDWEDYDENDERRENHVRKLISPVFTFNLFPSLRSLTLDYCDLTIYPDIVEGLASLKALDQFMLCFGNKPKGTIYLFKGLLELPLLNCFSLDIPFMEEAEWNLLEKFLLNQVELISLDLNIGEFISLKKKKSTHYVQMNNYIGNILKALGNLTKLRYLALILRYLPLGTLSEILGEISAITQLKTLKLDQIVVPSIFSKTPLEYVEGLCKFINRQKDLNELKIKLPFVIEESIIENIIETATILPELKTLKIVINHCDDENKKGYKALFTSMYGVEYPTVNVEANKEWYQKLTNILGKMHKLEYFGIYITINGNNISPENQKGLVEIFRALNDLKALRKFRFTLNVPMFSQDLFKEIEQALYGLKNVNFGIIKPDGKSSDEYPLYYSELRRDMNEKLSLRTDLMF